MPWRSKQFRVTISRRKVLYVTVRRFRTAKSNRAQSFRQLVLPVQLGAVKELALRVRSYKRPRRRGLAVIGLSKLRLNSPIPLVVLGIAGSCVFGGQIVTGQRVAPAKTFAAKPVAIKQATPAIQPLPASEPTNIAIPAVNIDVSVIPVGQASNGAVQMPPITDWTAGWYKYSPTPGQVGPSIIVGHVDNYENIWVFWRLRYVQPGNDVYISRADGSTAHFKVNALMQYNQADFPTQTVYGNLSYPGLRIITCGGTFNSATGSYDQNTVVYATLVS